VLFSSHLLEEVEQVADHVTMISRGKIALSAPLDEIRASHRSVVVHFAEPRRRPPEAAGVLRWEGARDEWTALVRGDARELRDAVNDWGARVMAERAPTLDEVFVAHVGEAAEG
jgi:ABC-2 type transport system ATP-binding protein